MEILETITGIVAVSALFIVLPAIIFAFSYKVKKNKHEIEKLKYQKEILELEVQKDAVKIQLLEQENKNLDKIIDAS